MRRCPVEYWGRLGFTTKKRRVFRLFLFILMGIPEIKVVLSAIKSHPLPTFTTTMSSK